MTDAACSCVCGSFFDSTTSVTFGSVSVCGMADAHDVMSVCVSVGVSVSICVCADGGVDVDVAISTAAVGEGIVVVIGDCICACGAFSLTDSC